MCIRDRNLASHVMTRELRMVLDSSRDFLQVGAVGPDLPYASIADDDFFFITHSDLADNFHYKKTNELSLSAFEYIKSHKSKYTDRELRAIFSFFLGFASHIIADGIIHPYIRDKVGDYKTHQTEHRVLEMQLDVLLIHYLTLRSGHPIELNNSNIHREIKNFHPSVFPEVEKILSLFCELISKIYDSAYKPDDILGWVKGLYRMFDIAEGEHPRIYGALFEDFLFSDYNELREKKEHLLVLKEPIDRKENFLKKPSIHYYDDVLPRFYEKFIPFAEKAYNYIYKNGTAIDIIDIAGIDLDTGRPLIAHNDLNVIPTFWS
jgi:hypothetical protein